MKAKELKEILASDEARVLIDKEVAAATKAETKRCLAVVKDIEVPEEKAEGKAVKKVIKDIIAGIKEA